MKMLKSTGKNNYFALTFYKKKKKTYLCAQKSEKKCWNV